MGSGTCGELVTVTIGSGKQIKPCDGKPGHYPASEHGAMFVLGVPLREHNCRFEYCTAPPGECPNPE
jgi:hypothetical protein